MTRLFTLLVLAIAVAPDSVQYTPDRFYHTYSAAHPPALRIRPGDRVSTKTVDAAGVDANVVDPNFTVVAKIRKSLLK